MEKDGRVILELLQNKEYVTAEALADAMKLSIKTVRLRIKNLNETGRGNGYSIQAKPRKGYYLCVEDPEKWESFLKKEESREQIPNSATERIHFLLAYLLYHEEYIKIDELSDFLFVSRNTLSDSLRQVERIVNRYDLQIDRKPNFGVRIVGREYNFRRCIGDCFVRRDVFGELEERKKRQLASIADSVLSVMKETEIHMTETSLDSFIYHVYVAIKRIRLGHGITEGETDPLFTEERMAEGLQLTVKEWEFVEWLAVILSQRWQIEISHAEKNYIALYLAGKRTIELDDISETNFIIDEEIGKTVDIILEILLDEFNIDLRGNFHVRMMLNSHLVPFRTRIRYGISHKNELLPEIKENYVFPYTMAVRIGKMLEELYHKPISEDEIGYFAMTFALGIEEMKRSQVRKSNILIVCNSGKGSSYLLKYRYQKEFGEYLNEIYISDRIGVSRFDFSKVDYVFTTVPISERVPVPIIEVGCFLENEDVIRVKKVLAKGHTPYLRQIYRPERFFVGIHGENREEILRNFCKAIERREKLPEGFLDEVMKRESLGDTDFGNLVAMPHPYKILEDETKVFVGILDKPVLWSRNQVQIVFLISVGKQDNRLPYFYEATTRAMDSSEGIRRLIQEKNYEVLTELLENHV